MEPERPPWVRLAAMQLADLPDIDRLERACFASPWSIQTYERELTRNPFSYYKVIRATPAGAQAGLPPILAYGGAWVMDDDAHIMTVASHPDYRRRHLAEWIVLALLRDAIDRAVKNATLEVRMSNRSAIGLYAKLGFDVTGRRRGYYPAAQGQPREDAAIMTVGGLDDSARQQQIADRLLAVAEEAERALRGV
jgi:ribosomal-protein-alanine N-acetyltransferase